MVSLQGAYSTRGGGSLRLSRGRCSRRLLPPAAGDDASGDSGLAENMLGEAKASASELPCGSCL